MPTQEPYPSSLTDAEWKVLEPLVPGPKLFGRPPRYSKRAILDAIFYAVRSGCAWRLLPHDLPPWRIVYYYFMIWRRDGLWKKMHDTLRRFEMTCLNDPSRDRQIKSDGCTFPAELAWFFGQCP